MIGLLICAAIGFAVCGAAFMGGSGVGLAGEAPKAGRLGVAGLALIAAALYLAWRAGGAGV